MTQTPSTSAPRIPGFTFVREIGHGGFADVYLYTQLTPRRDVAVKVLHSDAAGTEAAARLNKEADAMAGLSQHQNIVTVFQSGTAADGRPYLVMEYYPGPALSQGLRQHPRSLSSSLKIGIQLAGALESAHRIRVPGSEHQGILHRDIKPANILIDRWGRPVLGDFGIAMSNAEAQRGGAQGMSIPWSPPEAFDKDPRPTRQSDIWSLAATVYALLTGRAPFEIPGGDNKTHAMIDRIRNMPYIPLGRVDAPASLDQVLATAMAKSPQARYTSMKAFGMALREVEAELGLPPTQMDILDDQMEEERGSGDNDIIGTSLRPITLIDPTASVRQPTTPSTTGGWTPATASSVPTRTPVPLESTRLKSGGLEETQWRASASVPQTQPQPVAQPVVEEAPEEKKAAWWKIAIGVVILALIAGIVIVVITSGNTGTPTGVNESGGSSTSVPQNPVGNALPPTIKTVDGDHSADGTQAIFTWVNPDPQPGDMYRWVLTSTNEVNTTDQTEVSVPYEGKVVCITVQIIRSGVGSARATQGCVA